MKHKQHEDRKSFRKWAMTGQRVETDDMQKLNRRKAKSSNPYAVTNWSYKP